MFPNLYIPGREISNELHSFRSLLEFEDNLHRYSYSLSLDIFENVSHESLCTSNNVKGLLF